MRDPSAAASGWGGGGVRVVRQGENLSYLRAKIGEEIPAITKNQATHHPERSEGSLK